jgi:integrase
MHPTDTDRNDLVPTAPETPATLVDLDAIADDLRSAAVAAAESKSHNTRRNYDSAWRWFAFYCETRGASSLPAHPATVAAFLAARADGTAPEPPRTGGRPSLGRPPKLATVVTAAAAIADAHRRQGLASPTDHPQVGAVLAGLARRIGRAPTGAKLPLRVDDLVRICALHESDESPRWLRDRSVLLLGFASALRRSNLAALTVADLEFDPRGLVVHVARSKTDQEGQGRYLGVLRRPKLCPVRAVEAWLKVSQIGEGAIFRALRGTATGAPLQPQAIEEIVRRAVAELGYDPRGYGAHSLRSGLATAATGRALRDVMAQGGWADPKQAIRYQRRESVFDGNISDVLP